MLPRVGTTRQIRTNVLHLKRKASLFDQEISIGCDTAVLGDSAEVHGHAVESSIIAVFQ